VKTTRRQVLTTAVLASAAVPFGTLAEAADAILPSWNDGKAKQSIVDFVTKVTKSGSPDFVPIPQRIAAFDNDGTLWAEQPFYFQLAFALDRVKTLAPQHPEWTTKEPFASLMKGDLKGALAGGEPAIMAIVSATHTGITTEEFDKAVAAWVTTARHPVSKRLFTEMVYQPMLELLTYLRANSFKTFIVSGGGVDFMRVFSERVYGIPPEQVVGSTGKVKFQMVNGKPALMKLPEIQLVDDKDGKPAGIHQFIGRRPIITFGNSDGDQQMLEWTAAGSGARFMGVVHHTDAAREFVYDRQSSIGRLDTALTEAQTRGWLVIDMRTDWKSIFPPAK
jgi:phosphoglycolate phosphatase-like HAD superfamily hydrolase